MNPNDNIDDANNYMNPVNAQEATHSVSNTTYQTQNPFTPINDGTQRLTIRWSPPDYEELANDLTTWDANITEKLVYIFEHHKIRPALVGWSDSNPNNSPQLDTVPPEKIRNCFSPKISHLASKRHSYLE